MDKTYLIKQLKELSSWGPAGAEGHAVVLPLLPSLVGAAPRIAGVGSRSPCPSPCSTSLCLV